MHRCCYVSLSDDYRFDRWLGVGLTGATNFANTYPMCRNGHLDTPNIFYLWFFTMIWVSRQRIGHIKLHPWNLEILQI